MAWYYNWRPYVSVAERQRKAMKKMDSLRKKGVKVQPVEIEGRKIAKTFWGEAWCNHLESFSDFENRLPRGRTYVRNGSVCHLEIHEGHIEAKVSGSELYTVKISIKTLLGKKWDELKRRCTGKIGSLLELLRGNLSDQVMEVVTDRQNGLFPLPGEISLNCSCPDWAVMCKHVAATLYGVGARLDHKPELLFKLRGVDHEDLIAADAEAAVSAATARGKSKRLAADNLSDVFGIELDAGKKAAPAKKKKVVVRSKAPKKKPARKATKKKTLKKAVKKVAAATKTLSPKTRKQPKKAAKKKRSRKAVVQ